MTTQFTATDTADFDNDVNDINGGSDSALDTAYAIALSTGISVDSLDLTLPQGSSLEIDGRGFLVITSGDTLTVAGALTLDAPVTGDVLLDGATLTIDPVTNAGGIQGGGVYTGGISGETTSDMVVNGGAITSSELVAVHLTGGTITNQAGATISGSEYATAFDDSGFLVNGGTITGGSVGVSFAADGTVNNNGAASTISGSMDGIVVDGDATITNGGTISATSSDAIFAASGTVTNSGGGAIQTQGYNAVEIDGAGTVTNDGRVVSSDITGVYLGSGEVDNGLTSATALIQGAEFGVLVASGSGIVKNDGSITLSGTPSQSGSQIAVVLEAGGTVINGPASASVTTLADIAGDDYGVAILGSAGTVDNTGTITGSIAVDLEAGGNVVNGPGAGVGTIGGTEFGVRVIGAGDMASVTNAGAISGQVGVDFFDANGSAIGTLTDSGSIVSTAGATGTAVRFGDGAERLLLQTGYSITGIVQGGTGAGDVTTLELGAGTSGAFTGISSGNGSITGKFSFQNIASLDIDSTANWSFSGTESIASLQVGGSAQVGGHLTVATLANDTGGLQLSSGATLEVGAATGSGNTITLTTGATLKIDHVAQFGTGQGSAGYAGDTIAGFGGGDFIDLADLSFATATLQSYNAATGVAQFTDGMDVADLTFAAGTSALPGAFALHMDATGGTLVESVACYVAGTRIATPGGERPVESLCIGDPVLTADGRVEPVRWLGRRSYAGRLLAGRRHLLPIRFTAGSLGDGLPRRDLLVSPAHAMLLDGMLIPAEALVNGLSITRVATMERVDYIHVELNQHDAILAEGAPSETFLDDDSRNLFHNAHEHAALYPHETYATPCWCAPRVTHGHALEQVRQRHAAFAVSHKQAMSA